MRFALVHGLLPVEPGFVMQGPSEALVKLLRALHDGRNMELVLRKFDPETGLVTDQEEWAEKIAISFPFLRTFLVVDGPSANRHL